MTPILVTGAAGFIGFHVARRLLADGREVVGMDDLNAYYDPTLKKARLAQLDGQPGFRFVKLDLADRLDVESLFHGRPFRRVIHLAAQPGVRYSLVNPHAYVQANLVAFANVLEGCRQTEVEHLVYASSSSVYGSSAQLPFSVEQNVDHPVSFYAATKKANELMAHSYSHLFRMPATGLRFFTVYGPWGRPDMALFIFTKAIFAGEPIDVYNRGEMKRDFTYIDDAVEGVVRVLDRIPVAEAGGSSAVGANASAPHRVYNIGNSHPEQLLRVIEILEGCIGRKATIRLREMQPGDLEATYADVHELTRDTGFKPATPVDVGIGRFVEWYRKYYAPADVGP